MSQYLKKWPEIYSHCFWMGTFASMQVIFIISLSAPFLFKKIRWCSQRLKAATHESTEPSDQEQKNTEIKLGLSYQASKVCCLLMLAIHVLRAYLLLFHESIDDCRYPTCTLNEGLMVLSWIILSLAVFNFQESKSTKVPLLIRAWWTFNFLQPISRVVFDLSSILSDHEHIGFEEWINLFTLGVCGYLFAISITGTTGITLMDSSITEPFLIPSVEHQTEVGGPCLYGKASTLELITFSWMNPVIAAGYRKPLEKNDVPDINGKDSAKFLSYSFQNIRDDVERSHGLSTSSFYTAVFLFARRKAMINAGFAVLSTSASYVGPSLIGDLVKFLEGERQYGPKRGYLLVLALLSAKVVEIIAEHQFLFGAQQLRMRLQAALTSHVYQKGLQLSFSSRQKYTSGEIINYMDVDIKRISGFLQCMYNIWILPIELILAVYVLYKNLGAGAWAGLAATLVVLTCNIPLTRMGKELQAKIMAAKDERMKATTEVIRSMKILKLQAWDMQYLQKIESLRSEEFKWLWRYVRLSALTTLVFWGAPAFISSVTFGSCILMGIPLTAGSVLSALATFHMLQGPIFRLPGLLSAFTRGKVSADRVAKYLRTAHGGALVPVTICAQLFFQIFQVASNYWMAWASPPSFTTTPTTGLGLLISVYMALSMGSALCSLARSMLTSLIGLQTSEKFFKNMTRCILRAPMSFFDSTPTGRILNRASNDQSVLDQSIAGGLGSCTLSVIKILGTIWIMSQIARPVFAIFIPVVVACLLYQVRTLKETQILLITLALFAIMLMITDAKHDFKEASVAVSFYSWYLFNELAEFLHSLYIVQRYQRPAARELTRLSKIQSAPILDLFDNLARPSFHNFALTCWLSLRLNMLSNIVFAVSLALLLSLPEVASQLLFMHFSGSLNQGKDQ